MRSCITYAVACDGAAVTTIEGLDDDEIAKELRHILARACAAVRLLHARSADLRPRPAVRSDRADEREIRIAMSGNFCRCTGYVGIIRAITSVIESRRTRGIAAIPDAGRKTMGPAGSGHAKTGGPSNVQPSGATTARTSPPRVTAEAERATDGSKSCFAVERYEAFMVMSFQHSASRTRSRIRRLGLTEQTWID